MASDSDSAHSGSDEDKRLKKLKKKTLRPEVYDSMGKGSRDGKMDLKKPDRQPSLPLQSM